MKRRSPPPDGMTTIENSTTYIAADHLLELLQSGVSELNATMLELRNILLCWSVISIFITFVSLYIFYVHPSKDARAARAAPKSIQEEDSV